MELNNKEVKEVSLLSYCSSWCEGHNYYPQIEERMMNFHYNKQYEILQNTLCKRYLYV
jgi:hypothetical protein